MDISLIIKIIIVSAACLIGIGSVFVGKYKGIKENPIEKVAEEVIKEETGIDIELTPSSQNEKGS